jgi:two-component system, NtrC family, sensor histidine kinase KinB
METAHYRLLYELAKALHEQHFDPTRTLQTLLKLTGDSIGVSHGCLMSFKDSSEPEQIFVLGAPDTPELHKRELWNILLKQGLIGYVYHSDRILTLRNIEADSRWPVLPDSDFFPKQGSAVGIPLEQGTSIIGVLMFLHPQVDYFTPKHLEFLQEVGKLASSAVENLREVEILRRGDTRYQTIFEHTPVPVLLTDTRGIIEDANFEACEFLGYQRAVLKGIPLNDINLVPREEWQSLADDEEKYFRTETYNIDGEEIPSLVRARRVTINGRSFIEWILQDMTAQMELEQLRRDLNAMVYHDLRGPLGSINAVIHKLGETLRGHENPLVLKILQLGLRSTQQLSRLVDSLLDIQRLEEGKSILNSQTSEVHLLLTDALQLVLPLAADAKISIDLDIVKMPLAHLDTDMITRVVINLLENAIKYTPEGGKIVLSATMRGHEMLISIGDNGPGIPNEMRLRIFDKFSRVKYKNAPKGVGLGLAFCRLAVEAHGGRIWVESDGRNGSEFKFTLPLDTFGEGQDVLPADDNKTQFATTA